jgi:hypothetical protein
MSENAVSTTRRGAEIDKFLERLEASPAPAGGSGRLIFALDATASRQPSWDQAAISKAQCSKRWQALAGSTSSSSFIEAMPNADQAVG